MSLKIEASTRLMAAEADEDKAEKFLTTGPQGGEGDRGDEIYESKDDDMPFAVIYPDHKLLAIL